MSDTPAMPTSLDEIVLPGANEGPSPVPPVLRAPAKKSASKKPATTKADEIESQPPIDNEPAGQPAIRSAKESNMVETIQAMTDKTKTAFAEANERAKAQMEKGAQSFQELGAFNKGNIEAVVESSKIAAKGFEQMSQNAALFAKTSYENATTALKSMAAVKSPTELFKLQGDFMRASFDAFVAETSRTTEATLKLAGEIAQPLSNRVALAAEKIKVSA